MDKREKFGSRLGFILISAGCAIGLGNVWRFPYVVGANGGGAFLIFYIAFLILMGVPIMCMEFAVGRASRLSIARSFDALEPPGTKWHVFKYFGMAGNYLLMMFYAPISGVMLLYTLKVAAGTFSALSPAAIKLEYAAVQSSPALMAVFTLAVLAAGALVCALGLNKGVERVCKVLMLGMLAVMGVLAVNSLMLPGAAAGLTFYLKPDFGRAAAQGLPGVISAAMGQAFFTLSIGMGSMAIFGSYLKRGRKLLGESAGVAALDTLVALVSGLIIIPACFAFGIDPASGPGLIFVTLPNVFNAMSAGRLWGTLFFLFLLAAALSTVIAVFENIISFGVDLRGWSRKKSCVINFAALFLLSLPSVFGPNLLSGFAPFGPGSNVSDLEDFIVSNNILPLGSLVYVLFCTVKRGWGFGSFLKEANEGSGLGFSKRLRFYAMWLLPAAVLFILIQGYIAMFF